MICGRYNIRRCRIDDPEQDSIPLWSSNLTEDEVAESMERFRKTDMYFTYYIEPCFNEKNTHDLNLAFLRHCLSLSVEPQEPR